MPGRKEPAEGSGVDRLDLAAESRERSATKQPQDIGVAPLTFRATRPELAAEQAASGEQALKCIFDDAERETPPSGRLRREEWPIGSRIPRQQPVQCRGRRGEERLGNPDRGRDTHAVAIARDVLDRDPALVFRDPDLHGPATGLKLLEPWRCRVPPADDPCRDLIGRQVAEAAQQVVDLVDGDGLPLFGEGLQRQLQVGERLRIEQLAKFLLTEQLPQQVAVQRERAGASFCKWGIALVHVGGDVIEEEAARERAGTRRLDAVDRDLATRDPSEDVAERVEVEDVGKAFPVRLDEDREAAVATGDREQVGGPLALLPERGARPRALAWKEQRPRGVLAEA